MLSPLRNAAFRNLFTAQIIALTGTGLTSIALALLAFEIAEGDAGAVLGTALGLRIAAFVVIAPLVGAVAHRLPRKALLVGLDLARAAIVVALPFVDQVWQIYVLVFAVNAFSAGFTPTYQATIPDILPDKDEYIRALSISRLAYELEILLSPILAAALLTLVAFDVLFVLNSATFVVSALLVAIVVIPRQAVSERTNNLRDNLTFGLRAYMATPRLRALFMLSIASAAGGAMALVNTVVITQGILGLGETATAAALAAMGAGAMVVSLILPRVLDHIPIRTVILAGGPIMVAALIGGIAAPGFMMLLVLWGILGAGGTLISVPGGRLVMQSCRDSDRPAFYSAQFTLSHLSWLLFYPLAGWLGARAGMGVTFAALAVIAGVATVIAWRV